MARAPSDRIRPRDALRALRALVRDPEDTGRVFEVIDALSGRARQRVFRRFRASEAGQRLLAERPALLEALSDREQLAALPAGSLGRRYAEFMSRERISADGLVAASEEAGREDLPPERRWFADRLRDQHDLWHIVTGYERDLVGEAALLAFTFAQTRNPGIGLIVAVAYLKAGRASPGARPTLREAWRRGRRCAWLPEQRWEELLVLPLETVRARLGVGPPPVYEPLRSPGAPAVA